MPGRVELRAIERTRHTLTVRAWAVDRPATTVYHYPDVDLEALDERVAFHIAAFELNKLCVLEPEVIDFGAWTRFATHAFGAVWREVFRKVWAQWRFEQRSSYAGPRFETVADAPPAKRKAGETLLFCGGGKDSLVAARLLERAGVPFDSFAYAHAIYGDAERQHRLIDGLLDHLAPRRRLRATIDDDFLRPGMIAAETPSSLFSALPFGHARLIFAHERSANAPNLVWEGEPVNHQWGKSLQAERLLGDYVAREFGVEAFSLLAPVHDVVVFELLRGELDAVRATHSCNVEKPWCRRCAKCCYVWLGYRAHLPPALVDEIFGEDLGAVAANQPIFRQLLGEEQHKPFECVGEIDEARLFAGKTTGADIRERYAIVSDEHRIPADLAAAILPQLLAAAARARS